MDTRGIAVEKIVGKAVGGCEDFGLPVAVSSDGKTGQSVTGA